MTTSAIYQVLDALVAGFTTATTAAVFDGYPDTDDPGLAYVAVGVPDPNDDNAADSASAQQEWREIGARARTEDGTVSCVVVFTDPAGSATAARAGVKAITDQLEAWLRANPGLGVDQVMWAGYGSTTNLQQNLDTSGATAQTVFEVAYRAYLS